MEGIMKFLILLAILVAADLYAILSVAIENARTRRRIAEWEHEEKEHLSAYQAGGEDCPSGASDHLGEGSRSKE